MTEPTATDDARIDGLLAELTLEEKASLTAGADVWHLPAIDRLGITALKMSDGPSGVRGERMGTRRSLSFPCGMAAGATWDVDLISRYGTALAAEARSKGVHLLLGPTVCIPRTPLAGRTFESFSEDPHLSARLTVAYIKAVQAGGVGCCVKHFACNDQEHERMSISVEVDERALREVHLASFEAAVKEAGTWSIMSAYNRLDGTYCGEQPELLGRILKEEWGFDGVVVSDWFGTHSTVEATTAGLDVEMPGPAQHLGPKLAAAVEAGDVDEAVLDEHVRRILRLAERTGALDHPALPDEAEEDDAERRVLAHELVCASTVLVKNDGLLPLAPDELQSVALIGPNARWISSGGGGSSMVTALRSASLVDEVAAIVPDATVTHAEGCRLSEGVPKLDQHLLADGFDVTFHRGSLDSEVLLTERLHRSEYMALGDPLPDLPVTDAFIRATGSFTADSSGPWRLSLANTGKARLLVDGEVVVDNTEPERGPSFFGLGSTTVEESIELEAGRTYEVVIELLGGSHLIAGFEVGAGRPVVADAMEQAVAAAAEADVAVVVVGASAESESEGHDRKDLTLVGQQDELVRRVAAANPRTVVVVNQGAPVEMPWIDDVAAVLVLWYPGEEGAPALARMLVGDAEPSGRLPITFPRSLADTAPAAGGAEAYPGVDGKVHYTEGVFVGYRHHDRTGVPPLFAFGHGLGYTTFAEGYPEVEGTTVTVEVTNTGPRRGSHVVQLFTGLEDPTDADPLKVLSGFAKVTLDAGETRTVELDVPDLAQGRLLLTPA